MGREHGTRHDAPTHGRRELDKEMGQGYGTMGQGYGTRVWYKAGPRVCDKGMGQGEEVSHSKVLLHLVGRGVEDMCKTLNKPL